MAYSKQPNELETLHERHSAAWGKRSQKFTVRRQTSGRLRRLTMLLALILVFVVPSGVAQRSVAQRMSPELSAPLHRAENSSISSNRIEVIVQFRQAPTQPSMARAQALGATHLQKLRMINSEVFSLPADLVGELAKDPDIAYMAPNRSVHAANDYYESTVGGNGAQSMGYDGTGVGVALIDSGISDHPDLHDPVTGRSRVVYSQSVVPGTDTTDQYGHGTHVAGIIAGNGTESGGTWIGANTIYGVAPNVHLINLKVLDKYGVGQDSYVISALQRAIALKNVYNIRVVNISLGRPIYESYKLDPLCQAVEQAWKAGLVVVVAAGNLGRSNVLNTQGYGMITAPGNDPYVITVGAMRTMDSSWKSDDLIATYSSKGPTLIDHIVKPDLVAPGNRIASLLAQGSTLDRIFPQNEIAPTNYGPYPARQYMTLSGTSMAAPVVSGAAALLMQFAPSVNPDTVKARLMKAADKTFPANSSTFDPATGTTYYAQYDIFTVGAGYLNIPNALFDMDVANSPALSPVAVRNNDGSVSLSTSSSLLGQSVVWGSSVVWGTSVVWGSNVLSGDSVVWGTSAVWGDAKLSGNSVVWGSSVVWGTITMNGDVATTVIGGGDNNQ